MKKKPRCVVSWLPNLGRAVVGVLFVSFSWSTRRLVCAVWKSFGGFSPRCFLRILQKCDVRNSVSSVQAYVGELESPGQGWKHKPGAQITSQDKQRRVKKVKTTALNFLGFTRDRLLLLYWIPFVLHARFQNSWNQDFASHSKAITSSLGLWIRAGT